MKSRATFDEAPEPGVINFGVGQPSADLLPLDQVRTASERFFREAVPVELNYGEKQGDVRFREALADLLSARYGQAVAAGSLFLTAGSSQGLDFVCERFTSPGDTVFVEEPSYFLAFQIFRDHGLDVVGIPMDGAGMDLDRLESELAHRRPRLVYVIPSFHNPTGQSLSLERRERLVALSQQHGFLVVADEVYQMLHCHEPPAPALGTWAESGTVLSLGSFSKILAPGMRLGWIQCSAPLLRRLLTSGAVVSGGSFNHFTSHVVRHLMEAGLQSEFIDFLRGQYRRRLDAMDAALRNHLDGQARWQRPAGGYFFWLELARDVDAAVALKQAAALGTGFQPGAVFSSRSGQRNCLRLSFAHYSEPDIHAGIARVAAALAASGLGGGAG